MEKLKALDVPASLMFVSFAAGYFMAALVVAMRWGWLP